MGLEAYHQKRNFMQTPEPKGEEEKNQAQLRFVVQRHQASKLPYDFRLEMEGVLKSWAVPKGPSLNPSDKRLAVEVEDHPLSYASFEGDIPEGSYGAGHVDIWDEGTYRAAETDDPKEGEKLLLQGLKQGSIHFILEGEKLQGGFSLIRMKNRPQGAWLLIKQEDEASVSDKYDIEEHLGHIQPMAKPKASKIDKPKARKPTSTAKAAEMPHHIKPEMEEAIQKVKNKPKVKRAAGTDKKKGKLKTERRIGAQLVPFSSLDKFYWPEESITKGDLIDYYQSIADILLPYLKDRPQSLLRHPRGAMEPGFIQKDIPHTPEWVRTVTIQAESTGEDVAYLVCDNKAMLAYMNNLGCIQLNPWNSRVTHLEKPDYLVIDLDPGENTFDEVVEVALATKEVLDQASATAFCKTSGATGMHIFVPLEAKHSFEEARQFAYIVAQRVHEKLPTLTSLERSPKERRKQIYLDFLQNSIGQTIAAVYSVRPRQEATVSTPLAWQEVKPGLHPSSFTIKNMAERLKEKGDVFKGVLGKGIDLFKCMEKVK